MALNRTTHPLNHFYHKLFTLNRVLTLKRFKVAQIQSRSSIHRQRPIFSHLTKNLFVPNANIATFVVLITPCHPFCSQTSLTPTIWLKISPSQILCSIFRTECMKSHRYCSTWHLSEFFSDLLPNRLIDTFCIKSFSFWRSCRL